MKILFVNLSALKFTAATPDHAPLGGSESALCYLARALAQRGHEVALTAHLPEGASGVIEKVSHYPIGAIKDVAFFSTHTFDEIILCNAPAAAAPLKAVSPASRICFWAHVLPDQPSIQSLANAQTLGAIDTTIFVSSWQRGEVERVFGAFREACVIGNGIAPAFESMFTSPEDLQEAKHNRAAYTTTPYRGLSVLVRAMQGLDRPAKLDLFSSMRVYQATDDDYAALFADAAKNQAIISHGAVVQSELAKALRACAFLFYPSIYPETFCIAAAEAMAAGMRVVSTRLGALEETTRNFADLVPVTSVDGDLLVQSFQKAMRHAIDQFITSPKEWAQDMFAQVRYANQTFTWAARAAEWEKRLCS